MRTLQTIYRKVGEHDRGRRVWVQGITLEDAGYVIGTKYSIEYDKKARTVVLTVNDNGEKTVTRKKVGETYQPLIDLVNETLSVIFDGVKRAKIVIKEGLITIMLHHFDQKRINREKRLADAVRSGKPISMCSIAHGGGIMDYYLHLGFSDEGLRSGLIWGVEPDNTYLQSSWLNNPIWAYKSHVVEGRSEDIEEDDLEPAMVAVAGLPCTGASRSGRVKNKLKFAEQHESAGTAFLGCLFLIKKHSPAIFILENVPEYESTVSMHMLRETLSDWGYNVHVTTISGRELGSFEDRKRMVAVCVSSGIDFEFDLQPVREREQALGEILEDIPPDSKLWNPCAYLEKKAVRDRLSGKGFQMQLVDESSTKVGCIAKSYHKWRSTEPLVANHPTDPQLKRLLTTGEISKVKTIDPKLVAGMSRTQKIEMMGQSVIGVAFQALGRNIAQCLKKQFLSKVVIAA